MADTITNELMYEVLKKIRAESRTCSDGLTTTTSSLFRYATRFTVCSAVCKPRSMIYKTNMLRLEQGQTVIMHDVERIKRRLELADAE